MVVQDKSPLGPPRKSGLSCAECRRFVFLYLLIVESSDTMLRSKLKCDRYAQKILHIFVIKYLTHHNTSQSLSMSIMYPVSISASNINYD